MSDSYDAKSNDAPTEVVYKDRQPVLVVRGRDGALKAMSNVCRHRMSVLLEGRGQARAITCPYHGWTYNLDGSLLAQQDEGGVGVIEGANVDANGQPLYALVVNVGNSNGSYKFVVEAL